MDATHSRNISVWVLKSKAFLCRLFILLASASNSSCKYPEISMRLGKLRALDNWQLKNKCSLLLGGEVLKAVFAT